MELVVCVLLVIDFRGAFSTNAYCVSGTSSRLFWLW